MKTIVTEDWQRDALRVVIVDHPAHRVSLMQDVPQGTPILRMTPYDPEAMTSRDEQEAGILLPLTVARELYQALGRHFGDHQDPASRELVAAWEAVATTEGRRVDKLIDVLTARRRSTSTITPRG